MSKFKKLLAVILCFVIISGSVTSTASASLVSTLFANEENRKEFGNKITDIIQTVVKGVCTIYPTPRTWKNIEDFDRKEAFVYDETSGRQDFLTQPVQDAVWKVGYASGSIIPEDFEAGKYYIGRMLNVASFVEHAKAKGVLDDQRTRVVCFDDNSGKGAVVMVVIDGLGVTSKTIRRIREAVSEYTEDGRIAAVNVSATHCHSALDTQGVSNTFLGTLVSNIFTNLFGKERAATDNDNFYDTIVNVSAEKIKEAYANMTEGKLYYDYADLSGLVHDKREYIDTENMAKAGILRFVPDRIDATHKETYLVNMTCHPTIASFKADLVSSDYVYYFDKAMQNSGCNFLMTQGAVGMVSALWPSSNEERAPYTTISSQMKADIVAEYGEDAFNRSNCMEADAFGEKMASVILAAKSDDSTKKEVELPAMINAQYAYTQFSTESYTLHLACQSRLVDNEVCRTGRKLEDVVLPSEIGYLEFGGIYGLGLYPCEFYPEVFLGADVITNDKEHYSWNGDSWTIKSAQDMVRPGVDVYAVCFANDYIGYVVPDNYYSGWGHWAVDGSDVAYFEYDENESIFEYAFGGTADELLSAGRVCASQIMTGFKEIVDRNKAPV